MFYERQMESDDFLCEQYSIVPVLCLVSVGLLQSSAEVTHSSRHVPGGGPEERFPRVHHHLPESRPHLPQLPERGTGGDHGQRRAPIQTVTVQLEDGFIFPAQDLL